MTRIYAKEQQPSGLEFSAAGWDMYQSQVNDFSL